MFPQKCKSSPLNFRSSRLHPHTPSSCPHRLPPFRTVLCLFCCAPCARGPSQSDEECDRMCLFRPWGNWSNKVVFFFCITVILFKPAVAAGAGRGRIQRSNAALALTFQTLITIIYLQAGSLQAPAVGVLVFDTHNHLLLGLRQQTIG